jgi:hypothetical protein
MHSSKRTIDDMMKISDDCDPHHYIKGKGIVGGMVFDLPHNKLSDENILINKANIDLNTTDIDDLVHSYSYLAQSVGGKDFDKRINWLIEKINDIGDIENTEKNKGIIDLNFDENEKGYMTDIKVNADRLAIFDANRLAVDKVLSNYAKEGKYKLGGREHSNIKAKVAEFEESYPENNPIFKEYHTESKKDLKTGKYPTDTVDTRRGDISEEFSINNDELTRQFRNIDTNDSPLYNSKNPIPYTPEFKNLLKPKYIPTNEKERKAVFEEIKKELGYYPIDGIKIGTTDYGTLWELKSYSTPLEEKGGKQKLSLSKIEGRADYKIKYKKDGNDFVIENVYYNDVPTLPYKPLGYKYFWAFDNKDRIGYANPLTKKAGFRPIKNKDGTYNGSWDKDEVYGNDLYINNKDIKIYPKGYYKTFKEKRINK